MDQIETIAPRIKKLPVGWRYVSRTNLMTLTDVNVTFYTTDRASGKVLCKTSGVLTNFTINDNIMTLHIIRENTSEEVLTQVVDTDEQVLYAEVVSKRVQSIESGHNNYDTVFIRNDYSELMEMSSFLRGDWWVGKNVEITTYSETPGMEIHFGVIASITLGHRENKIVLTSGEVITDKVIGCDSLPRLIISIPSTSRTSILDDLLEEEESGLPHGF